MINKNIYFNHLKIKSTSTILVIISALLLFLGYFEIVEFKNEAINRIFISLGFLCQILFLSKMFWYKNYVEWNKLGMNVKLNCWVTKYVSFNNVETVKLNNENLIIVQKSGIDKIFNIRKIHINDLHKLVNIINVNVK